MEFIPDTKMKSAPKDFRQQTKLETMDPTFYQTLEELLPCVAAYGKTHQAIKGLECHGIMTWRRFIDMDVDDLSKLTHPVNGIAEPLFCYWIRILGHIKHLVWMNMEKFE